MSGLAVCVCGRTFAKSFGLRVHQRTCPAVEADRDDRDLMTNAQAELAALIEEDADRAATS